MITYSAQIALNMWHRTSATKRLDFLTSMWIRNFFNSPNVTIDCRLV